MSKKNDYLKSPKGQIHQLKKRREKQLLFYIDVDTLHTKKSKKTNVEIEFQRTIIETMNSHGRRMFRGPVAVNFHFFVAQNNPPAIHSLPKYYIDLLQNLRPELRDLGKEKLKNGAFLLVKDDRQIKYLNVEYVVRQKGEPNTSSLYFTIEPMSSIYDDLLLSEKIERESFPSSSLELKRHESELRRFYDNQRYEDVHKEVEREQIRKFQDLLENKDAYLKTMRTSLYELMLFSSRQRAQEEFFKLHRLRRYIWQSLFDSAVKARLPKNEKKYHIKNENMGHALLQAFSLKLPGTPTKPNSGQVFLDAVKTEFETYHKSIPFLNPVVCPMRVTILLVPPDTGGKDLDNLALKIVPVIHQILKPPTSNEVFKNFNVVFDLAKKENDKAVSDLEFAAPQFKGLHTTMVTAYTVVELPRPRNSSKDGIVHVLFEDGNRINESFLDGLRSYIDKWKNCFR